MPKTLLLTTAAAAQTPDLILYHGQILTGAHLRPDDPAKTPARVTAIAIAKGRIQAIGPDTEILKLKSPTTQLIDLQNAFAMPGFNDAHTHMAGAGQQKLSIDLDQIPTLPAMLEKIRTYAATRPSGTWLQGGGWDHTLWPDRKLPTRQDLDTVTGNHPAILERTDGHIAVANSAALAAASITRDTPDPEGARIDHDANGEPTGILREGAATKLVFSKIPPPSTEDRRRALDLAIADALSHGVTSVQDFSTWDDFLVLETMEHTGKLSLRVSEWLDFTLPLEVLKQRRASHPMNDPLLHTGLLKAFMDGSLGSRTAALAAPYADDPSNSGIPRFPGNTQDGLNQLASERAAVGFQLGFHAIGDKANDIALNALTAAEQVAAPIPTPAAPRTGPDPDSQIVTQAAIDARRNQTPPPPPTPTAPYEPRFRIEHAQVLLPEDFQRFHDAHIIASMQPSHLLTDMNWAAARLGPGRVLYAYAWKSFLDHGVTLAFGTDYPVESINPFRGLYAAITRKNESGTATFQPQEALTINQALYAYTQASAFADHAETFRGRLEPTYLADIVVLDRDPTAATPGDLLKTKVLRTIVAGKTVYESPR